GRFLGRPVTVSISMVPAQPAPSPGTRIFPMPSSPSPERSSSSPFIEMKDVSKWYGKFHALKNVNLTVGKGERIVLCGPSGSGKSTLIRCINRLEPFEKGTILVD